MTNRQVLGFGAGIICALLLVPACTQVTRYRILSFFFDGVPEPGADDAEEEAGVDEELGREDRAALPASNASPGARPRTYFHTPYLERRCSACHDMLRGRLVETPEGGLCVRCHGDLTEGRPFVHGPVAVNACLACHHFHMSPHPEFLLMESKSLCLGCHPSEELLPGEHHATIESDAGAPCINCHDPHAGGNRLFLKRSEH